MKKYYYISNFGGSFETKEYFTFLLKEIAKWQKIARKKRQIF
jgi:hypothetical protein